MRGPWLFSGDKYSVDEDGVRYAGRSDDLFRVSGQWVSPAEVECALIEHASVSRAAVIAYEEENKLHTPMAFVVLKHDVNATSDLARELQDFVKQRITPYKYPRRNRIHLSFRRAQRQAAALQLREYTASAGAKSQSAQ